MTKKTSIWGKGVFFKDRIDNLMQNYWYKFQAREINAEASHNLGPGGGPRLLLKKRNGGPLNEEKKGQIGCTDVLSSHVR